MSGSLPGWRKGAIGRLHGATGRCLGRLSTGLVLALAMTALTAIFAIFGFNVWASRQEVGGFARSATADLAAAVGERIGRDIEFLDTSLQDLSDGAGSPAVMALPRDLRRLALFDRPATAHGLGAMMLLDASGRPLEQVGEQVPAPVDFSKESFFKVHAAAAGVGLYVSEPFMSLADGEPCIALSRRVERGGVFGGVAMATIKVAYFDQILSALDLGPQGTASLLSRSGAFIARVPFVPSFAPTHLPGPAVAAMSAGKAGMVEVPSVVDGVRRLFVYQPVGTLPLALVLGRGLGDIFAAWWQRAALTGIALLLLGNLILLLIAALRIALRQRAAAEAELAALARLDMLTGLPNRRRFDEALHDAWRRALQEQRSLALLLLDIDHFKQFNDMMGHQGGDAVLTAIGRCLSHAPRRAGDLAARYGGEEFAVLLPDTTEDEALAVAGAIEERVRALRQPHPGASEALLTVSIGAAALVPSHDRDPGDIIRFADLALYRAKRAGRDRTVAWKAKAA